MRNPWLARNPFLSRWMSGAGRALGTARGHATKEMRRQQRVLQSQGANAVMAFWSGVARTYVPRRTGRRK